MLPFHRKGHRGSESQHNVSVLHCLGFQSQISNPGLGDSSALLFFPQHRTASHGFPEIEPESGVTQSPPVTKSSRKSQAWQGLKGSGQATLPEAGISSAMSTE